MRDTADGEVIVTILAAGMDATNPNVQRNVKNPEVFVTPTAAPAPVVTESPYAVATPKPIGLDEIDLDIPTFLRRQRGG